MGKFQCLFFVLANLEFWRKLAVYLRGIVG